MSLQANEKAPETRWQRHRKRKRNGVIVCQVEVHPEDVAALMEHGLLDEDDRTNRERIGAGAEMLLCALSEGFIGLDESEFDATFETLLDRRALTGSHAGEV